MLGDLVVGLSLSSGIMLGSLWICSIGWIRAALVYGAAGVTFGASWQLALACVGAVVTLPAIFGTFLLARQALRLPAHLLRSAIA